MMILSFLFPCLSRTPNMKETADPDPPAIKKSSVVFKMLKVVVPDKFRLGLGVNGQLWIYGLMPYSKLKWVKCFIFIFRYP